MIARCPLVIGGSFPNVFVLLHPIYFHKYLYRSHHHFFFSFIRLYLLEITNISITRITILFSLSSGYIF
jgi:hypothetical protein